MLSVAVSMSSYRNQAKKKKHIYFMLCCVKKFIMMYEELVYVSLRVSYTLQE